MQMNHFEQSFEQVSNQIGINLNGKNPEDIIVHSVDMYKNVIESGSLGLGESYVNGLWDCKDISGLFYKITSIDYEKIAIRKNLRLTLFALKHQLFNFQTIKRARRAIKKHYNIGNKLYKRMLDSELNYSCAYWENADNLEQAQQHKLDLICRKIHLEPGMRVLDVGCGWGSFARFAAKNYSAEVTGITISQEQIKYAKKRINGLPIKFLLQDYRLFKEKKFDRIISIGMFEHVGAKNYKTYFKKLGGLLKKNGLFLLHTIGSSDSTSVPDPWIDKYIFPDGKLPSLSQIMIASEEFFCVEDLQNIGSDYDKTLLAWNENFIRSWDKIKLDYDQAFFRLWTYYLQSCAGAFRSRNIHLWQLVLSKNGVIGGYKSVRSI